MLGGRRWSVAATRARTRGSSRSGCTSRRAASARCGGCSSTPSRGPAEREQFGERILDFQGISFPLADSATECTAARLLDVPRCAERGRPRRPEAGARTGLDGQAVRLRGRVALRRPLRADVRRARLHAHERRRAVPARAARRPDLGGHERDPAADRRRARSSGAGVERVLGTRHPRPAARRSTSERRKLDTRGRIRPFTARSGKDRYTAYGSPQGSIGNDPRPAPARRGGRGRARGGRRRPRGLREHDDGDRRLRDRRRRELQARRAEAARPARPPAAAHRQLRHVGAARRQQGRSGRASPGEGGTLRLYNYADYINPATVKKFEKQFNCKVQVATYNSADEAYAKLAAGSVALRRRARALGQPHRAAAGEAADAAAEPRVPAEPREEHLARAAEPVLRPRTRATRFRTSSGRTGSAGATTRSTTDIAEDGRARGTSSGSRRT